LAVARVRDDRDVRRADDRAVARVDIGLSSSQMIRPVGSSITDHSDGKAVMWLPGNVVIVLRIQVSTSSRPFMVPAACSM